MKIYVINLDKDKDRLTSIDGQLARMGVEYERFPAVWAANLTKEDRRRVFSPFRWWCVEGYPLREGQLGVTVSHNAIYQKMILEDIPIACILEDDARLTDEFNRVLDHVASNINADAKKIVLLTNYTAIKQDKLGLLRSNQGGSAEAYVITQAAARAILSVNKKICTPCDNWARFERVVGVMRYQAFPTVCLHGDAWFGSYSDPRENRGVSVERMKMLEHLVFKCKRLVGVVIDRALLSVGV